MIRQVLASRAQRLALVELVIDYGDDLTSEMLDIHQLDSNLQHCQRCVHSDLDALDEAVAELDRMHAEIND